MLKKKEVKNILNISDVVYSGDISVENGIIYINGKMIDDEEYYNIVVIDFLFDKYQTTFDLGIETQTRSVLFRDVLIKEFEIISQNNETWLG